MASSVWREATGSWVGKSVPKQQGTRFVVLFLFLCHVQKEMAPIGEGRKLASGWRRSGLLGLATNRISKVPE